MRVPWLLRPTPALATLTLTDVVFEAEDGARQPIELLEIEDMLGDPVP